MNKAIILTWRDKLQAVGLLLVAAGILTQIYFGVATVTIPVGAIVMSTIAGLILLRFWRWMPAVGVGAATFVLIGAFIAPGLFARLSNPSALGTFTGTLLQMTGLVVAIIAGALATLVHYNAQNSEKQFGNS